MVLVKFASLRNAAGESIMAEFQIQRLLTNSNLKCGESKSAERTSFSDSFISQSHSGGGLASVTRRQAIHRGTELDKNRRKSSLV
jgi:hypothetical protein